MTYEETKEHLKKLKSFHNGAYGAAVKMAITAIDKQIPKKPNSGTDRTWGTPMKEAICPVCDYAIYILRRTPSMHRKNGRHLGIQRFIQGWRHRLYLRRKRHGARAYSRCCKGGG